MENSVCDFGSGVSVKFENTEHDLRATILNTEESGGNGR